ncbi:MULTISPECIES: hypothetical protein [Rhizobium]|uniref:Argininosuccinate lyase n=2 Tax=Rhizobium etli TaxID=29449 RepID=A0AAN1EKZ3_RHIET|nr:MULTISPECIES: hypothetical protein [Rhizobium]ABC91867.1 hypothetical conserved protein [Rhizobium etli CFN 42]AGS22900.1 hypothetical protein REMIM1_CH03150 [Rhizobium etli bv. mimosae str. Mim1]ARO31172.1 hypothetical protein NXC14_CH03266 [Rhizobium sp. NXC14]ARQ11203.1 hypothetical protein NXC12_CH03217 [Rhizobium etli]MBB3354421.1 hypothetical protein [Rhizobium sp. BK049]
MKSKLSGLIALAAAIIATSAVSSHAEDLKFQLTNGTKSVLTRFYSSPTGVNSWEEDVFGEDVLNPGETVNITIADGRTVCKYDMRFEFDEDSDLDTTEDTQDLCALGSYTIHE